MTEDEIREIEILQKRGTGFTRIASVTKLPVNTVKSYVARHPAGTEDVCLCCGKPLVHTDHGSATISSETRSTAAPRLICTKTTSRQGS